MVPLVMSTPREDNPNGAFEEFATHLSLYDDSFHFVEKSATLSSRQMSHVEDKQGSLPPSVFCPSSKNTDDVTGQVKVKRKCGRPRNPIPRHKRESHINAEHRRRGKIQDGFRTLKNIVPKYEQSSGRDSKADILFKAVEYSRKLQNDMKELGSSLETLRAERDRLSSDIKSYKTLIPDLSKYDNLTTSIDDRYTEYVRQKTKESWSFGTFKVIMRPLFESYKLSVQGESMVDFLRSVDDWASQALSLANLRTVCLTTLKDVPYEGLGGTSPYKDAQTLDMSNLKSAASGTHPLTSDSNNNIQHLNNHVLTSQHNNYRDSANTDSNRRANFYGNTFDSTYFTTNNSYTLPREGHGVNLQQPQELAPFSGGSVCSGNTIFSDLYYNLDHNLHHNSIVRANLSRSDYWSNHNLQQQQWHYYQGHHMPAPGYFQDLKKVHPYWGSEHQPLSQNISGNLSPECGLYHRSLTYSDKRELKYDLISSRETPETAPGSFLCHTSDYLNLEHNRPSQSSSESEGSLLNMETFARQATETLGGQEKYAQLSPSTDSCISPGSSLFVPSPGLLSGRHDYTLPHHNTSSLDHLKQPQSAERVDSLDSQQALPLPSYKNTFGARTAEHRHQATRHDGEVRHQWGVSSPTSTLQAQRLESSTLLAEMLGQKSPQIWSSSLNVSTSSSQNISSILPVKSSVENNVTDHLTNGFSFAIKHESTNRPPSMTAHDSSNRLPSMTAHDSSNRLPSMTAHDSSNRLPSMTAQPSPENMDPRDLSLSPKRKRQEASLRFQANTTQGTCSTGHNVSAMTDLDMPNSSWLHPNPKLQRTFKSESAQPGRLEEENLTEDDTQSQISYFELAHQQLLKQHNLHNGKVSHVGAPDKSSLPTLEADVLNKTDTTLRVQTPASTAVTNYVSFLGQVNNLRLPVTHQPSWDTILKHKSGRKSSFEEAYPEVLLQTASECKKMRQFPDKSRENLLVTVQQLGHPQ